jgi:hypothetical protein
MKKIRHRLRAVRAKLARVTRAIEVAHRRTHHFYAQARRARANAEQLRRQGKPARAKRADQRADNRRRRAEAWLKRTNWLAGKRRFLDKVELQAEGAKRKWLKDHPAPAPSTSGLTTFDGVTVAAWFVPWLTKIRNAGWGGHVVSGYRDPAYSTQLCYGMCGAPSCPGRCAGASSNHSGKVYPAGAVDVTDYYTFERLAYSVGSPLRNHLPADPVHFSVSGF